MAQYESIKHLVIETCKAEGSFPSYEKLTSLVRQHFPMSKWQKTHYAWYKSQIKTGKIPLQNISFGANGDDLSDDIEAEVEESIYASLSLERDLHRYLAERIDSVEPGLSLVEDGVEYQTDAGRIDLLTRDREGNLVAIELKAGVANDSAIGQLLGYIGCLTSSALAQTSGRVRGILVAADFDRRVIFAARGLGNIKLIRYRLSFALEEIA